MDTNMTTWNTECFGALAMSTLPTHPIVSADCAKTQGTTVSTATSALIDPAYKGSIVAAGTGVRFDRTVAPIKTSDVSTPRLQGPPV
jgi:hypothetical protein